MMLIKLSKRQTNRSSEVFGNLAVAWFSAGVISPVFLKPQNLFDLLVASVLSLIMAGVFFVWSLYLVRS